MHINHLKPLKWLLLFVTAFFSSHASAEVTPFDALKFAAQQQVLTQVMLKNYCQIGQEIRFLAGREDLQESIKVYDANLVKLQEFQGGEQYLAHLEEMKAGWTPYKKALTQKSNKDDVVSLSSQAESLISIAKLLGQTISDANQIPHKQILNLVTDQILVIQQAATHYLLTSWQINPEENRKLFKTNIAMFDANLVELSTAQENNKETGKALGSITKKWTLFKSGHKIDNDDELVPDFVVRICDSTHSLLSKASAAYMATSGG